MRVSRPGAANHASLERLSTRVCRTVEFLCARLPARDPSNREYRGIGIEESLYAAMVSLTFAMVACLIARSKINEWKSSSIEQVVQLICGEEVRPIAGDTLDGALCLLMSGGSMPEHDHSPVDFSQLPRDVLAWLYEDLLSLEPVESSSTGSSLPLSLVNRDKAKKRGGNFYTPPDLSDMLAEKTLKEIVFEPKTTTGHQSDWDWAPRDWDRILQLRVLDPSMGGGSFLLSAVDYLVDALEQRASMGGNLGGKTEGNTAGGALSRGSIRRLVLSRCIYGVDVDPIAVRVCVLTLWLDAIEAESHAFDLLKILRRHLACGNALVGCLAAPAEAGSSEVLACPVRGSGADPVRSPDVQGTDDLRRANDLLKADVHEAEAREADGTTYDTGQMLDWWCALWFLPRKNRAGKPHLDDWLSPTPGTMVMAGEIARKHRFFHWNVRFEEVFSGPDPGFDAVIGNPPWEIEKPNSREFFLKVDPYFWTYGKQQALARRKELFRENQGLKEHWRQYEDSFRNFADWVRHSGTSPMRDAWLKSRQDRPFRYQGSGDMNAYKLFLERSYCLLKHGGRLGLLLPSGIYADKGSAGLRELLLDHCTWQSLIGWENREGLFAIHRSFKFCLVTARKGERTSAIESSFMHRDLDIAKTDAGKFSYTREYVTRFSPRNRSLLEIESSRDLAVLSKIFDGSVMLDDPSWPLRFKREFDMTIDSSLFALKESLEEKGFRADEYGHWLTGRWRPYGAPTESGQIGVIRSRDGRFLIDAADIDDVALPLYEGRMVGQFDFSEKGWLSGKGRSAIWQTQDLERKEILPQYLMRVSDVRGNGDWFPGLKVGFLGVGSATNTRSMIAACINLVPCGNSVPVFRTQSAEVALYLVACLNSYVFDYVLRCRMAGNNLNYFMLEECPLPRPERLTILTPLLRAAASLSLTHPRFAGQWLELCDARGIDVTSASRWWAVAPGERTRLRCVIDAVIAELYGLSYDDLLWILRGCDYPQEVLAGKTGLKLPDRELRNGQLKNWEPKREELPAKGFWRVDKNKPPELRQTILTLAAFKELKELGLPAFLSQRQAEGWRLPESLCLRHLGLGRDDRAGKEQPVSGVLGGSLPPEPAQPQDLAVHAANMEILFSICRDARNIHTTNLSAICSGSGNAGAALDPTAQPPACGNNACDQQSGKHQR